jgi:uncharacterized protein YoxC
VTPFIIALVIAFIVIVALAHKSSKLSQQLAAETNAFLEVETERDELKHDYDGLLAKANNLAEERAKATQLVAAVESRLDIIGTEVREMVALHYKMRRALERIAQFQAPAEGGNYTETLKELAAEALPGLTMAGLLDKAAFAYTDDQPGGASAELFQALSAAGGVALVNEGRPTKVDLSGQAERIKAALKEQKELKEQVEGVVTNIRELLNRPLTDNLDASPLAVAVDRLGTEDLQSCTTPSGLTIVTVNPNAKS